MKCKRIICLATLLMAAPLMAQEQERKLFIFETPEAAAQWQTINDGVMGGRSDGRFKINNEQNMEFYGTLSLENNGGFASVRSRPTIMNLTAWRFDRGSRPRRRSTVFDESLRAHATDGFFLPSVL